MLRTQCAFLPGDCFRSGLTGTNCCQDDNQDCGDEPQSRGKSDTPIRSRQLTDVINVAAWNVQYQRLHDRSEGCE